MVTHVYIELYNPLEISYLNVSQLYILDVCDLSLYDNITFALQEKLRMNFDLIL